MNTKDHDHAPRHLDLSGFDGTDRVVFQFGPRKGPRWPRLAWGGAGFGICLAAFPLWVRDALAAYAANTPGAAALQALGAAVCAIGFVLYSRDLWREMRR